MNANAATEWFLAYVSALFLQTAADCGVAGLVAPAIDRLWQYRASTPCVKGRSD
jgi:hypothetical protein